MKFVKGKQTGARASEPAVVAVKTRTSKAGAGNPWIDRRHFDTMADRCIKAEGMCKELIRVVVIDDGEFLASHDYDYLAAGAAILRGDV